MSDLPIETSITSAEETNILLTKSINELPHDTMKDMSILEQNKIDEDDEDLEDGEIDDDDDEDNDVQVFKKEEKLKNISANVVVPVASALDQSNLKNSAQQKINTQVVIDLLDERTVTPPPIIVIGKSKKAQPLEDDHASSIEHAIANALKKRGIDPPMPKMVGSPTDTQNKEATDVQAQSRSSRRRKRKKQRDNKEHDKDRKEKKKRYDSSEAISGGEEDDMDEYEMLNVRGGSPPPSTTSITGATTTQFCNYKDSYDSGEDSESSYESYDSADGTTNADVNIERRRRQATHRRETRKRRDRNQNQREKRSRRDSMDEKHQRPQEPRKLELCKFYLMECCAKKEKCSYMHSDFPCKFYYLGMECILGKECKFGHGEPLNEQLRNILLKHLETAPKEILGNFKRISREQAIVLLNKRHEELCVKFSVENTWTTSLLNMPAAGSNTNNLLQGHRRNAMNTQNVDSLHQQASLPNAITIAPNKIPSLLDMVINPPQDVSGLSNTSNMIQNNNNNNNKNNDNKQRKSRWTGEVTTELNADKDGEEIKNLPSSYLDLCNLTGILSMEHIDKLTQMGISNLEQFNQLTFGQLIQIGLTITEISDIQAKLQGNNNPNQHQQQQIQQKSNNLDASNDKITDNKNDIKNAASTTITTSTKTNTSDNSSKKSEEKTKETLPSSSNSSSSKSNHNSAGTTDSFDYTQYLRDSNITFDRLESYEDEKDDEKLIIDDGNMDTDEGGNTPLPSSGDEVKGDSDINSSHNNSQQNTTGFYNAVHRNNSFRSHKSVDGETENRERSHTPTRSQSSTPEATESPDPDDMSQGNYERATIYDYNPLIAAQEEDQDKAGRAAALVDTENRFQADGLQLPFTPVANFTPATEIDGSITSYLPVPYKVYELDLDRPSYLELRKQSKPSDLISDPRLRRILGLPELRPDSPVEAISSKAGPRGMRKLSNNIASPDSEGASPKYYIPPSSNQYMESKLSKPLTSIASSYSNSSACTITTPATTTTVNSKKNSGTSAPSDPRARQMDPRRAASAAAKATSTATSASDVKDVATAGITVAMKQNVEIRSLLQQSEWYKNLNSKFKIMVNQQLALVSTELKKFHQNPSPQKIFDISFILNNSTLQQILTQLGIFIDDNGEVAHIDGDNEEQHQMQQHQQLQQMKQQQQLQQNSNGRQIHLPNLSQPPPDFMRGPPPNLTAPPPNLAGSLQNLPTNTQIFRPALNITPFGVIPPNARPSLLGLPPSVGNVSGNVFNPFSADLPSAAFAAGLLGTGHGPFGNFSGGPQNPNAGLILPGNMRNFSNNNNSNAQRNGNRNNRRNKI